MTRKKERPRSCGNSLPGTIKVLMDIINDVPGKIKGGDLNG